MTSPCRSWSWGVSCGNDPELQRKMDALMISLCYSVSHSRLNLQCDRDALWTKSEGVTQMENSMSSLTVFSIAGETILQARGGSERGTHKKPGKHTCMPFSFPGSGRAWLPWPEESVSIRTCFSSSSQTPPGTLWEEKKRLYLHKLDAKALSIMITKD